MLSPAAACDSSQGIKISEAHSLYLTISSTFLMAGITVTAATIMAGWLVSASMTRNVFWHGARVREVAESGLLAESSTMVIHCLWRPATRLQPPNGTAGKPSYALASISNRQKAI